MPGSNPPRVSIALCTYNGAQHLPQQLESLLAQDLSDVELVACDDASTDASFALLQRFASRFRAARIMRNDINLGLTANFERVFRECRSDWIAPCDQDDVWAPNKLRRLLAQADAGGTLVYADSLLIDADGRPFEAGRRGSRVSDSYCMIGGSDPRVFALSNCISGHSSLVRRTVLERALPLPSGVPYDAWIAFVAANLGAIRYVDEALVQFRQHERNASGFAGQLKQGRTRSTADKWQAELRHLEAQAAFDGPQQAFFAALLALWQTRGDHRFTPGLAMFLNRHRSVVFAMKHTTPAAKWRHALKYLPGLKGRVGAGR